MNTTIAVFFGKPNPKEYLEYKDDYFQAYLDLTQAVESKGAHLFFVSTQETYLGGGTFSQSWQFQNGQIVESGQIQAELVFNKSFFKSDGTVKVFNCGHVDEICTNKWLTYKLFQQHCPLTFLVHNDQELQTSLQQISTELVVYKPVDGGEGRNVFIQSKTQPLPAEYPFPFLVQEFLDSTGGVPGIIDGMHDFRVAIVDGQVAYSYYRTPPQGSYLANVARGGRYALVPEEKIPSEVMELVKKIDQNFAHCLHRFYGVDVAFTPNGIKIIELNSKLGLLPNRDGEVFKQLKEKLAEIFISY